MWFDMLTTLRGLEGRIISVIDLSACAAQAGDPSYGSINSPSRGRSRDSLSQRLIRLRWKLIQMPFTAIGGSCLGLSVSQAR